jgi:hypothetical protein
MFYETDGASKRFVGLKGFVAISINMTDAACEHFRRTGYFYFAEARALFCRQAADQRRGSANCSQRGEAAGAGSREERQTILRVSGMASRI